MDPSHPKPDSILHLSVIVGLETWQVENVRDAPPSSYSPKKKPSNRLFLLDTVALRSSSGATLPGLTITLGMACVYGLGHKAFYCCLPRMCMVSLKIVSKREHSGVCIRKKPTNTDLEEKLILRNMETTTFSTESTSEEMYTFLYH